MTGREKGVASTPCGTCGKDLHQTQLPDGALARETCSKCSASKERASKKAASPARERGTDTKEKANG